MALAPRKTLDDQLGKLRNDILVLGSIVEQAVIKAVDALHRRDFAVSQTIYDSDSRVNEMRFRIEQEVLELIATQQPIAKDLRILASILEVNTELERMGDYAKSIAKITIKLSRIPPIRYPSEITLMADLAAGMLHKALTAFNEADAETARSIPQEDTEVDKLYNQVTQDLIRGVGENPTSIDAANDLMWVSHNLERLADRVTNICERTVFVVTGDLVELDARIDERIENVRS